MFITVNDIPSDGYGRTLSDRRIIAKLQLVLTNLKLREAYTLLQFISTIGRFGHIDCTVRVVTVGLKGNNGIGHRG